MKLIMEACQGAGFDPESTRGSGGAAVGGVGGVVPLSMGYKTMLGLIEQLKACAEVATTRTGNWQSYCHTEKSKCCVRTLKSQDRVIRVLRKVRTVTRVLRIVRTP